MGDYKAIKSRIKLIHMSWKRNGISGEPFYQVVFQYGDSKEKFVAIVTDRDIFVIEDTDLGKDIKAEYYEAAIRKLIKEHN